MGSGLLGNTSPSGKIGSHLEGLVSPRNIIQRARNSVGMSNTVTEGLNVGLSIMGGRKEGWENPNSTARNALHNRDPNLTVKDIVDSVLRKQAFGFEGYNPKPVVKDLLPVHTHVKSKAKRRMFCEEAAKAKEKVPSPDKYQTTLDWAKSPETRTAKFFTDKRRMIANEIIHRSKFKEKTSPGPAGYHDFESWRYVQKKVIPNYKQGQDRVTFVQE